MPLSGEVVVTFWLRMLVVRPRVEQWADRLVLQGRILGFPGRGAKLLQLEEGFWARKNGPFGTAMTLAWVHARGAGGAAAGFAPTEGAR